jgi:hypothetical protein
MNLRYLRRLAQNSLLARMAILAAAVVLSAIVVLPVGYAILPRKDSLLAGGLAAGICLPAGWIALGIRELLRRPQQAVAMAVAGATVRLGIVFAAAMLIYWQGGPLVSAGVLYYLIAFYQVMLSVEIVLVLPADKSVEESVAARDNPTN